jgi:hypothetical protein
MQSAMALWVSQPRVPPAINIERLNTAEDLRRHLPQFRHAVCNGQTVAEAMLKSQKRSDIGLICG